MMNFLKITLKPPWGKNFSHYGTRHMQACSINDAHNIMHLPTLMTFNYRHDIRDLIFSADATLP
jgi:hypothetical protein